MTVAPFELADTKLAKKINVLVHYSSDRGDHFADVASAVEPYEGETLAQFAGRMTDRYGDFDVIEVRIVDS